MRTTVAVRLRRGPSPRVLKWGQFSLRSLCIATALVSVAAKLIVSHVQLVEREQHAATVFTEAGGRIVFDTAENWVNSQPRRLPPQWIRKAIGQEHFQRIVAADLCGVDLTNEQLEILTTLSHLRSLDLVGPTITDETLAELPRITSLHNLTLTDTRVTAARMAQLKSALPELSVHWHVQRDCSDYKDRN